MTIDRERLEDLKDHLDLLYEKLGTFEKELIVSSSPNQKFELEQRIKREILPDIRKFEAEYWEIYPTEAIDISEEEAQSELARIKEAVSRLPTDYASQELVTLLQDIKAKLDDLDNKTAASKLKLVLPLIPAIASYEFAMNPGGLMYKIWNKIRQRILRDDNSIKK